MSMTTVFVKQWQLDENGSHGESWSNSSCIAEEHTLKDHVDGAEDDECDIDAKEAHYKELDCSLKTLHRLRGKRFILNEHAIRQQKGTELKEDRHAEEESFHKKTCAKEAYCVLYVIYKIKLSYKIFLYAKNGDIRHDNCVKISFLIEHHLYDDRQGGQATQAVQKYEVLENRRIHHCIRNHRASPVDGVCCNRSRSKQRVLVNKNKATRENPKQNKTLRLSFYMLQKV